MGDTDTQTQYKKAARPALSLNARKQRQHIWQDPGLYIDAKGIFKRSISRHGVFLKDNLISIRKRKKFFLPGFV